MGAGTRAAPSCTPTNHYRILTWLLPIPFGGFAFNRWRDSVRKAGHDDLLEAFDDPQHDPATEPTSEPAIEHEP